MKFGNKVGTSNINESTSSERNQNSDHTIDVTIQNESDNHSHNSGQSRQKIQEQSSLFAKSSVDEYTKISDLLRDFMKNDSKGRSDSDRDAH